MLIVQCAQNTTTILRSVIRTKILVISVMLMNGIQIHEIDERKLDKKFEGYNRKIRDIKEQLYSLKNPLCIINIGWVVIQTIRAFNCS